MTVKKYLQLLAAVLIVLGAAAAGCAAEMETFNMGLASDAKNLDPHRATDTMSFTVLKHIQEPLVTVDGKTKELVPVLVEKWEMLDPETYKFYLKKGVKFHNGEEFTAEDVVFSFTRVAQKESVHAGNKGRQIDPDGFQIVDKYTVIVKTRGPLGGWLEGMKHPYASIFNKKAVEDGGEEYFRNPVGTGPFKFKNWVKGEKVELERFEEYHGKKANFKNLNFLVIPDDSSRVIALETGKVDMIYGVPPSDLMRLNSSQKTKVVSAPGLRLIYLGANTQKKPLDDPRVRLALEYGVNKEAFGLVVYQGNSTQPAGPLVTASTFTPKDATPFPYDPKKAKELLKEAGFPDGLTLNLWTGSLQDNVNGATVLQSMLAQVGITIKIQVFEPSALMAAITKNNDHDLYIAQWGMQTSRNAGDFWLSLFSSGSVPASNWAMLKDDEMDRLLALGQSTVDQGARTEVLQKIWDRLAVLHPIVPLVIPNELYGARKDLRGVEDLADGQINYLGNLHIAE
ncbi:MAG: ABC transporter substrate-binding protein [Synergistaceae bacterium]|nr:ABC transporter substrate-binding protein [Synergistaceae bacterium]